MLTLLKTIRVQFRSEIDAAEELVIRVFLYAVTGYALLLLLGVVAATR